MARKHPCQNCKQANTNQPHCPHSVLMAIYPRHCQALQRMTARDAWAILRAPDNRDH